VARAKRARARAHRASARRPAGFTRLTKETRYVVEWRDARGRAHKSYVVAASRTHAARKVKKRAALAGVQLDGVRASKLWVAEFMIGRGVGFPIGTRFEHGGKACTTGLGLEGQVRHSKRYGDLITYEGMRNEFLRARAEQVGEASTGATIIPAEGVWHGGREPSALARVYWTPWQEPSRREFQNNMVKLCEALACRLSQKEVLLRLMRPAKQNLLLRCSPTGAHKPRL
jgi:hypothetical protein